MGQHRSGASACPDAQPANGGKPSLLISPKVSVLTGLVTLVVGLGLTVLLSDGAGLSTRLYLAAAENELFEVGYRLSEAALITLVAAWAVTAGVLVLRRSWRRLVPLIIGGVAAGIAYASSQLLKVLIANTRPCNAYEAVTVASCPSAENWSYPSNHTVIACALAVSLLAAMPRAGLLLVPAALLTGFARVLAGHHYPHDVLGGAVLGISITASLIVLTAPAILSILNRLLRRVENGRLAG